MKVTSFEIENCLSFRDKTGIALSDGLNLFVGPNGGGKSNLLDSMYSTLRLLMRPWVLEETGNRRTLQFAMESLEQLESLGTYASQGGNTLVTVTLEPQASDIESFNRLGSLDSTLEEWRSRNVGQLPDRESVAQLLANPIEAGMPYTIHLRNGRPVDLTKETTSLTRYLHFFEQFQTILQSSDPTYQLSIPVMLFPVHRAANLLNMEVTLASISEKSSYHALAIAQTRTPASALQLALFRIGSRYRRLQESGTTSDARNAMFEEADIRELSELLRAAGYEWDLKCRNPNTNAYEIVLKKEGRTYLASRASSGERELLNLVFGVFALGAKGGMVLIDEPELHLHPRWQRMFLDLFEKFTATRELQVIAATHAAAFITPRSIHSVRRVYLDGDGSHVKAVELPADMDAKHVLSVVNSHNNERIFFADFVLLVEGISDRLVFESLFEGFSARLQGRVVEVVEVHGKTMIEQYARLLTAAGIVHGFVADLDYLEEVGVPELKRLFQVDSSAADRQVASKGSRDGKGVIALLERVSECGSDVPESIQEEAAATAAYLRSRHTRMKRVLDPSESALLDEALNKAASRFNFFLRKGEIEDYLPVDVGKDIEALIKFLQSDSWIAQMRHREELEGIVSAVIEQVSPTLQSA